jgi:hypothetical protein
MSIFDGSNGPTIKVQFYFNGSFTDIPTTDIREIDLYRGRPRADQRVDAGTFIVLLDNRSGDYDPDNLSGPWVTSGITALAAGLRTRLIATWSSVDYILYDGYLETTDIDPGFDAVATMTFTDGIAKLAKVNAPALSTPGYSGETTATRVGRMLTYASWGTGSSWRSLTGTVTLLGTDQNTGILDIIDECVQCESGAFYMSRSGVATFINLQNKFARPTQLTFDDSRAANTIEYNSIKNTPGTYQVVNACVVNRDKYRQKFFKYKPSIIKYGERAVALDAPVLKDSVAQKLATYTVRKNATPSTLIQEVNFTAIAMGVLYPDFLETELQDMIIVKRTTVDGRNLTFNLVIEGFRHKITPDDWDVTLMTSPVNAYRIYLP